MINNKLMISLLYLALSAIALPAPRCPFSEMEIQERTIPTAEIKFTDQETQNELIVDRNSSKSPFEQYLDAIADKDIYPCSELETPYRDIMLLNTDLNKGYLSFYHPHRLEVNHKYATDLQRKLMQSNLLVAAAYAQMHEAHYGQMLIDAGKHGLWKCGERTCWKVNKSDIKKLMATKDATE